MEDNLEKPAQTGQEAPAATPGRFRIGALISPFLALGKSLPRLGLYLFMLAAPLVIVGYPAYLLIERLAIYTMAQPLEAEFVGMEINKVKNPDGKSSMFKSKGHIDVLLSFKDANGKAYVAVVKKPWTSPGLKGKMEDQYQKGDPYTLYVTKDGDVRIEEDVARDNFRLLTLLMGLAFIASVLFVLIRKRLSTQQPAFVHLASSATAKSIVAAQATALLLAGLMTMVISYRPIYIPDLVYLGGYWSIVAFLAISLRLLVFEPVHPEPAAETPDEHDKAKAHRP